MGNGMGKDNSLWDRPDKSLDQVGTSASSSLCAFEALQ
jgi:hypothetical protein